MKKYNLLYYIGMAAVAVISYVPIRELIKLWINIANNSLILGFANENYIVPFSGVVISLLLGYLLIPFTTSRFPPIKSKVILTIVTVAVFVLVSIFSESMVSKQHAIRTPLPTTPFAGNPLLKEDTNTFTNDPEDKSYFVMDRKLVAAYSPEYLELDTTEISGNRVFYISVEGTYIFNDYVSDSVMMMRAPMYVQRQGNYYYYDASGSKIATRIVSPFVMMSRSGISYIPDEMQDELDVQKVFENNEEILDYNSKLISQSSLALGKEYIPFAVKIHYYIFSTILVVSVLHLWEDLYIALSQSKKKTNSKLLVVQGLCVVCYALAYLFVKPITYAHFDSGIITTQSAISALLCIVFGGISVGFFSASFIPYEKKKKMLPPFIASLTVLLLYMAEYLMLGKRLYQYGENWFFKSILYIRLSPANLLVILLPAVIVAVVLRLAYADSAGQPEEERYN